MRERVILVDDNNNEIGTMDKTEAHHSGKLHRAFSVFIFNSAGQLLLQQRAANKYHSAGKWTNTCCSHPRPGEETFDAANRRLMEEMGLSCTLKYVFNFKYCVKIQEGITENEYDHVFFSISDTVPVANPDEVEAYKYVDMETLKEALENNPANYTKWLLICFDKVLMNYKQLFTLV